MEDSKAEAANDNEHYKNLNRLIDHTLHTYNKNLALSGSSVSDGEMSTRPDLVKYIQERQIVSQTGTLQEKQDCTLASLPHVAAAGAYTLYRELFRHHSTEHYRNLSYVTIGLCYRIQLLSFLMSPHTMGLVNAVSLLVALVENGPLSMLVVYLDAHVTGKTMLSIPDDLWMKAAVRTCRGYLELLCKHNLVSTVDYMSGLVMHNNPMQLEKALRELHDPISLGPPFYFMIGASCPDLCIMFIEFMKNTALTESLDMKRYVKYGVEYQTDPCSHLYVLSTFPNIMQRGIALTRQKHKEMMLAAGNIARNT